MTNVFNALSAMLFPFDSDHGHHHHYQRDRRRHRQQPPRWPGAAPRAAPREPRARRPAVPLPTGLITPGSGGSVIWRKITYTYPSPISYFLVGTMNWTNNFYSKPRRVAADSAHRRHRRLQHLNAVGDHARGRIRPSCATDATSMPSRVKIKPRLKPRAPDAEGLSWA